MSCILPTLVMVFVVVLVALFGGATEGYENTDWWTYITYTVTPFAFAIVAYAYLRYRKIGIFEAVRRQKCHPKYFLLALGLQVGLFALAEVNGYFLAWLERFGYQPTDLALPSTKGFGFVGVLFAVAVLPAVFEEIVFRGIVLNGLKRNFSFVGAVLLCGGLFALYHQRPEQTWYQFACGTAYALLAMRSGSLLPTMFAHFLNNAVVVTLYSLGVTTIPAGVFLAIMVVAGVCLIGTLGYLIVWDKNQPKRDMPTHKKDFWLSALVGIVLIGLSWLTALFAGF